MMRVMKLSTIVLMSSLMLTACTISFQNVGTSGGSKEDLKDTQETSPNISAEIPAPSFI